MQHPVISPTLTDVFRKPSPKKTPNNFGINRLGPQPTDFIESSRN